MLENPDMPKNHVKMHLPHGPQNFILLEYGTKDTDNEEDKGKKQEGTGNAEDPEDRDKRDGGGKWRYCQAHLEIRPAAGRT